jgi:hypothetical protein
MCADTYRQVHGLVAWLQKEGSKIKMENLRFLLWSERNESVFRSSVIAAASLVDAIFDQCELWCRAGLVDSSQLYGSKLLWFRGCLAVALMP